MHATRILLYGEVFEFVVMTSKTSKVPKQFINFVAKLKENLILNRVRDSFYVRSSRFLQGKFVVTSLQNNFNEIVIYEKL